MGRSKGIGSFFFAPKSLSALGLGGFPPSFIRKPLDNRLVESRLLECREWKPGTKRKATMNQTEIETLARSVEQWNERDKERLGERRAARARLGLARESAEQEGVWLRGGVA